MKTKKFWNLRSKFLLIFYGAQTEDAVEEIFKFSWQSNIYDLMLVLFRNSQTPNIFLWYPYFPTITKIDSCEFFKPLQKKLSLTEVPKMLIPRPLKVEVVIFPPYVISHDSGSDIRIVKELAAAMGTQASVNHSDIPFNFGIVLPNKTVSGMFGAAYYERVDMAIGGFILQPDKYALLDASYPYHNEFYYWCVPRAHKLPSWKQVFDTMNLETWILILLAYIVFTVVLWSLSSIRRQESFYNVITNCFFNIFAIFIGANVGVKPKSTFVRFFVLFWTMVCLILHIIYETKFISLMERGLEEKQIKTMEELLDSDLEIQMKSSSVILFGESPTLRRFVEQGYHQCKTVVSCIEKVAYSRNASVFASASFISYIKNLFIGEDNLPLFYCFDSGVDISPIFIGMRKGFPLKDYVDTILKRLVEVEERISSDDCLMDAVHNFTDFGETIVIHCSTNYCGTYFDKLFTQIKLLSLSPNGVVNMGREVHIVELDTYQDTEALLTKLKPLTSLNPNAKFVVVFYDKMVSKAIETIFEMLWSLNIYNAVVYSFKEGRSIYFWYPYFKNVTVMGGCEVGPDIKARKPSFGDIPKVLVPNPLKVEIVIHPPYIISKSEGLDIQIVKEFARIFNTELLISHSAKPYDYGMIFFNGTATGMSGEVFHKRVDMGVGSFILQPERFEHLDSSYPYYNEMYYWCVPRARRIISWRQVFATLQWQTWLLILFIFVTYTVILYLLSLMEVKESFYKKFSNSIFNNFAIFIGASGHVLPRSQSKEKWFQTVKIQMGGGIVACDIHTS
ncbi:hypothetical protein GEV33_013204 [Tenebrio molitor]|uniref:Ionotropic glutamate receptor C-terminal domain-containing protein n=1 Tax=Tenebrio molitor TaxID=7067 RepID=A0A8J6L7J4_TENMO|nr:hypothetical protein GEV33_013204 [Tenebrio molitor]